VGGLTAFKFRPDESVEIIPLTLADEVRHRVEDNLLLFFTGLRRPASEALALEQTGSSASGKELNLNLDDVRAIGYETMHALTGGDLTAFGDLLTAQWQLKFDRSPSEIHHTVDGWIREGIAAGAAGGKLVGAGGGGFLLFYAPDKAELRNAMDRLGLTEVRFGIDYQGTTTIVAG
jgi:D-glycero-alpha-D-manno-heptose-7-phosphate kinase